MRTYEWSRFMYILVVLFMTCWCCSIFKLFHTLSSWSSRLLSMLPRSVSRLHCRHSTCLWSTYKNILAGFILDPHTSAGSAWWVQHQQKQIKFCRLKLACHETLTLTREKSSVIKLIVIPQKLAPCKNKKKNMLYCISSCNTGPIILPSGVWALYGTTCRSPHSFRKWMLTIGFLCSLM